MVDTMQSVAKRSNRAITVQGGTIAHDSHHSERILHRPVSSMLLSLRSLLAVVAFPMVLALLAPAWASETPPSPRPFDARYHLQISGWPDARIEHRLSQEGSHWRSDMRAAVSMAKGSESSRFRVSADGVRATAYNSGYSLLGIGGKYRLAGDDLVPLPDRQAALFELSRQSTQATECGQDRSPCSLRYLDHKGREEVLHYQISERRELTLPAGVFDAVTVESWDPEHPERRLTFNFHPEVPGLLLTVDYHRDGERKSRLTLGELSLDTR